jgi:hypothetical protein
MAAKTAELYLLEDLEDPSRTGSLADADIRALQSVADWIKSFIVRPHPELGRPGPVCPFVPESLERNVLWLAPEHVGYRDASDAVEAMEGYKRLFLDTPPIDGNDATYKVIVVVFTDLAADHAWEVFGAVVQRLAVPSYVNDGILFGPFYEGNQGTALYNTSFRPFQSPAPFMFVRQGVISDWKFYMDDRKWLSHWAQRYGDAAVHALADELRRLPWRARGDRFVAPGATTSDRD